MTATSSIVHLAQSGPQGLGPLREVFAQPAQDIDACNKPVDCGLFCSCIERWANMAISVIYVACCHFHPTLPPCWKLTVH
eukprot:SAG31_NODE_105_length_25008_cov_17.439399_12_plen_80_part_00